MGDVLSQVIGEEGADFIYQSSNTLLSREIYELTYKDFLTFIEELNLLSKKFLDSQGHQLVFVVRKDSDSTLFWRATVQIDCIKLNKNNQIVTYRPLNFREFLKVFKTFKWQVAAAKQSKRSNEATAADDMMSFSTLSSEAKQEESSNECIICFERKQEVTLPCAHSYCTQCIEEWNESHDTCPICREKLKSPNDTWVISEMPEAEEISKEIQQTLLELTHGKPSSCTLS